MPSLPEKQEDKTSSAKERYFKAPKGKKAIEKYRKSPKGKRASKKYQLSEQGKIAQLKYRLSEKGQLAKKRRLEQNKFLNKFYKWQLNKPQGTLEDFLALKEAEV